MEAVASETERRPILVWAIYVLHCVLLVGVFVWFLLTVLRMVPSEEEFALRLSNLRWSAHVGSPLVFGCCYLGAHRLFFRKSKAVAVYLSGPVLYLAENIGALFATCIYPEGCPGFDFFGPILLNLLGFGFVVVLIIIALKSWPPNRTPSRVDA